MSYTQNVTLHQVELVKGFQCYMVWHRVHLTFFFPWEYTRIFTTFRIRISHNFEWCAPFSLSFVLFLSLYKSAFFLSLYKSAHSSCHYESLCPARISCRLVWPPKAPPLPAADEGRGLDLLPLASGAVIT